jgi:hypothetical protein
MVLFQGGCQRRARVRLAQPLGAYAAAAALHLLVTGGSAEAIVPRSPQGDPSHASTQQIDRLWAQDARGVTAQGRKGGRVGCTVCVDTVSAKQLTRYSRTPSGERRSEHARPPVACKSMSRQHTRIHTRSQVAPRQGAFGALPTRHCTVGKSYAQQREGFSSTPLLRERCTACAAGTGWCGKRPRIGG